MRRYRDCGESYEALAKRFGVARSTVRRYLTVGAGHHRHVYFDTTYA